MPFFRRQFSGQIRQCKNNKPNNDNKPNNFYGFLNIGFGHNIVGMRIADEAAAVYLDVVNQYRTTLPTILRNFIPDDIYNADESALFFKCLPNKTLAYKGTSCHGGKASKERVTILPICNMSGESQIFHP